MRILLVDDSRSVHAFVKSALQTANYQFDDAYDGAEAFERIHRGERYDLILMDWEMPVLTGVESVAKIRSSGSSVPILMVTSKNDLESIATAIATGANEYIMKPFTAEMLREKIEMALTLGGAA